MLRRMKEDVESSLKAKQETIVEVELTAVQKQYYRAIYQANTKQLVAGDKGDGGSALKSLLGGHGGRNTSLNNIAMELRKCCNHPYLIKGAEDAEFQKLAEADRSQGAESQFKALIAASGKMVLLEKLLPKLKANGHRVIIFSQFKMMHDILHDYLQWKGFSFEYISGDVNGIERQNAIDRYQKPDGAFIMLLTTKAGGVGITLTAADTCIIYDSDWNPQNDLQAMARCHRIGQTKSVKIYRLLTAKTYEAHMFHISSMKLGLDRAVLHGTDGFKGKSADKNDAKLTKAEVENLLKRGAYAVFNEEDAKPPAGKPVWRLGP
jgi:chromodomain-helicase-DNA-binding protein 7